MPYGSFFLWAMCHNLGPSLIIIMDNGDQGFKIYIYVHKFSYCLMLNFNGWMTTNDVNMTSWV